VRGCTICKPSCVVYFKSMSTPTPTPIHEIHIRHAATQLVRQFVYSSFTIRYHPYAITAKISAMTAQTPSQKLHYTTSRLPTHFETSGPSSKIRPSNGRKRPVLIGLRNRHIRLRYLPATTTCRIWNSKSRGSCSKRTMDRRPVFGVA
jgi:hypothetical protein